MDGTTATWTTALLGHGDVTLNGAATLVGTNEMQGAVGGKWTVGDGFTAGLEGAASLLGGLDLGEGATVTVDIATNRSAVFTSRDFSALPGVDGCITDRFNRVVGGTTRGTITHDETILFTKYLAADRPFGNFNRQSAYAVGEFYVEESAAGQWMFSFVCDDRIQFWIDGELVHAGGNSTVTTNKTLTAGWHTFRHVTIDNTGADTGNAGPWSGKGLAVSYQVANGAQTLFSEQTLQLSLCPDGYVQGGVTLASGATLANGAAENAAVIYGDVAATGTGATISGPFKFEGGTLAFRNVVPATTNLADVLAFSNVSADMLANVGAITVDYVSAPTRGKIPVCPLYGLTEEAAKDKIAVTIAGEPAEHIICTVENGNITLRNTSGTMLFFR